MTQEQAQAIEFIRKILEQVSLPKAGHIQVEQALKIIQDGLLVKKE
jgi:hypothetical protein